MPERIRVEVAYAEPERQLLLRVELVEGTSVADAIAIMSGKLEVETKDQAFGPIL